MDPAGVLGPHLAGPFVVREHGLRAHLAGHHVRHGPEPPTVQGDRHPPNLVRQPPFEMLLVAQDELPGGADRCVTDPVNVQGQRTRSRRAAATLADIGVVGRPRSVLRSLVT